jgi:hypothetical protein
LIPGLWILADRDRQNHMTSTCELDGVGQQVQQHLLQSVGISFQCETMRDDQLQVEVEADCGLFDGRDLGNLIDQLSDVERTIDDSQGVLLTTSEIEKITDHRDEASSAGPNQLNKLFLFSGKLRLHQQITEARDSIERSPEFMRGVGHEIVLDLVESDQIFVHLLHLSQTLLETDVEFGSVD